MYPHLNEVIFSLLAAIGLVITLRLAIKAALDLLAARTDPVPTDREQRAILAAQVLRRKLERAAVHVLIIVIGMMIILQSRYVREVINTFFYLYLVATITNSLLEIRDSRRLDAVKRERKENRDGMAATNGGAGDAGVPVDRGGEG